MTNLGARQTTVRLEQKGHQRHPGGQASRERGCWDLGEPHRKKLSGVKLLRITNIPRGWLQAERRLQTSQG